MEFLNNNHIYIYNEFGFNNGNSLNSLGFIDEFLKVKHQNGVVDEQTVGSLIRATMNAYIPMNLEVHFKNSDNVIDYYTLLQKDLYFNQHIINTEQEFDEIFEEFEGLKNHLFRGLSEAKYALYSTLQREWINRKLHLKFASYQDYLSQLVENARKVDNAILKKYLKKTGFIADNDLTVLSFLQHYGCPTPLVDWTYNFKVALFFATQNKVEAKINKYIDKYFAVYFLEQKYLDEISINRDVYESIETNMDFLRNQILENLKSDDLETLKDTISNDMVRRLALENIVPYQIADFSKIESMMNLPTSYLSEKHDEFPLPNYLQNSLNIISQEGVFTWNNDAYLPFEAAVKRDNSKSKEHIHNKIAGCININKELKGYIIEKLKASNIIENTIYPNPRDIANRVFENAIR